MSFPSIVGETFLMKVIFVGAIIFVGVDVFITLFTIFYQKFLYNSLFRKKVDVSYTPKCTIFLPCKGVPKDFEKNIQGFMKLDYPEYYIIFIVENEKDPATEVIRSVIKDEKRAKLVVAGLATTCVQKNHNLLAGIKSSSNDTEVFVFADADIKPDPHWLSELILPLSNHKITVTTGFRWLHPRKGTLGEMAHFYVNIYMYVLFSFVCFFGGIGLWGGSMAIRKKDFEELGVAEKWSKAGVDDMSLSHLVFKARKKAVIVPRCISHTDDLIPTVKGTIKWFERQIMYLKSYQKKTWLFMAMPFMALGVLLMLLLPISLILSFSTERTFLACGGGAALVFYIGELFTISLYPFLGDVSSMKKFYLYWPVLRFSQAISFFLTLLTNTITWAGVKYKLAFNGDVISIERPENPQ
ncbi:MAG: glycosyltransferase family 2 protein [Chitinispirillaceae bacterium]|nr:glycosyltransferase family 2 protein [Chitinispirillaceae bacterium]